MPVKRPSIRPAGAARTDGRTSRGGLSPKQQDFLEWLTAPVQSPRTQTEWAAEHAVSPKVVTMWRNHDGPFRQAWTDRLAELNVSPENVNDVLEAMRRRALEGSDRAATVWLQYADRINDKSEDDALHASDLSDDELRELIESQALAALELRVSTENEQLKAILRDVGVEA